MPRHTDEPEHVTDLVDLTDVSLSDLLTLDSPHLAESLRRVLSQADEPGEIVAGFNSAI